MMAYMYRSIVTMLMVVMVSLPAAADDRSFSDLYDFSEEDTEVGPDVSAIPLWATVTMPQGGPYLSTACAAFLRQHPRALVEVTEGDCVDTLTSINELRNPNRIAAGQTLLMMSPRNVESDIAAQRLQRLEIHELASNPLGFAMDFHRLSETVEELDGWRQAVDDRMSALTDRVDDSEARVGEAVEEVAELRGTANRLSAELAGKVDVAEFDKLLAQVETGAVISQAQFDTQLQQYIAEQDLTNFFDLEELRRIAQDVYEERLAAIEGEQARLSDEVQEFGDRLGAVEAVTNQNLATQEWVNDRVSVVGGQQGVFDWRFLLAYFLLAIVVGGLLWWWYMSSQTAIRQLQAQVDDEKTRLDAAYTMAESASREADKVQGEIGPIKDRLTKVEEEVGLLMELDAQGRFNNPALTAAAVASLRPGGDPLVLRVKCHDGRYRQVQVVADTDEDGVDGLRFIGLKKGVDFVHKPDLISMQKHLAKAVQKEWIIGITAARVAA